MKKLIIKIQEVYKRWRENSRMKRFVRFQQYHDKSFYLKERDKKIYIICDDKAVRVFNPDDKAIDIVSELYQIRQISKNYDEKHISKF